MIKKLFVSLCLSVTLAVTGIVIGCGDSGSSSPGSSKDAALPKVAFIKKGDAICRRLQNKQIEALQGYEDAHPEVHKELKQDPSGTRARVVKVVAVAPIDAAVNELRSLNPPKGDQKKIEALLEAFEEAAETLEREPSAFFAVSKGSRFASLHARAAAYGFKTCSKAP
jgi:hypothetical protein